MTQGKYARDLLASVVVFLVALPLCMGIAIASGAPAAAGLITGIVGGLLVGSISGSPLQVSGPAAGLAVIVFELVRDHGIDKLGPILIGAGLIQMLAGVLRLGQWFRAISPAVIYGMLAGIGVLILAGQFHVMLDDAPKETGLQNLISIPAAIVYGIFPINGSPHEMAALIGLLTITTLVLWNKFKPERLAMVPGALLAVAVATAAAGFLQLNIKYVDVPANLLDAIRLPTMDGLLSLREPSFFFAALAMAFIASAETLLSASAVDRMQDGPRTNYDRELAAQGIGNTICGLLGALPMTGVIVRSSANVQAGAKTRLSAILHGAWILAFVATLPWLLRMIPICSLAAILVFTGYKLVETKAFKEVAHYGRIPVLIYVATVVGIVAVDLLTGVLGGLALSLAHLIYKVSHIDIRIQMKDGSRADVHIGGSATFIKLPRLAAALERIPPGTDVHIHCDQLVYIDHACLDLLARWRAQQENNGTTTVMDWDGLGARHEKIGPSPRLQKAARGEVAH